MGADRCWRWGAATTLEEEDPQGLALGEATTRQQESECRLAAAHLWRILAPIDAVGAEVELTYWANRGALTMLSWRRTAEGKGQGEAVDERAFTEKLWRPLLAYVGEAPRTLRLVQRREKGRWVLHSLRALDDGAARPPPEAKTLPVDAPGIAASSFAALEHEARTRWLPLLKAPADGGARLEIRVELEDERFVDSSPVRYETTGRGVRIGPPPAFETQVAGGLVPFTQGLGRRAVHLVLLYARCDGCRLGDLGIGPYATLIPFNERLWDESEPRLQKLLRFGRIAGLADYFATVPSLAGTDGAQPVVYLQSYIDKTILPFASNVDRAFALYARYCDEQISLCGSLWDGPPFDRDAILFPDSFVKQVAQDEPLVRLLAAGRFDDLVLPDEASRAWVQTVLATARALH